MRLLTQLATETDTRMISGFVSSPDGSALSQSLERGQMVAKTF